MSASATKAPIGFADIARWGFWVPLRRTLPVGSPHIIRQLYRAWRMQHLMAGQGKDLMLDEYQRCFADAYSAKGYQGIIRDAYRASWRVHLDELLLGKVDASSVDHYIQFNGISHLHSALERGKGVVWLYPHAGPVMMMMAWLGLHEFPYTQYAARGLAPDEVAKDHPELLASNTLREAVRLAREENEDRLPVNFVTLEQSARTLYRCLAANELVGIAFDGRIGNKWVPTSFLGRQSLLNPGPYRLAASTGAAIVPAFCHTPASGPAICEVGAPILPTTDPLSLMEQVVSVQEAWIRRWPEEYGIWMLHARTRNRIDDHPLFVDHAEDDRWKRWVPQ
jgi:lauroyl/myristoyl acyltransferase